MIKNTLNKILFWLNCARLYSLPITILNWIVIFIYALYNGGNILNGVLALFGICLVHLATNLIDDYFDYKILIKDKNYMNSAQNCKCAYLKNNEATPADLKRTIIVFLGIAGIIGLALLLLSGYYVIVLTLIALLIAIFYQKFSLHGCGEIFVIVAYGPLLFEGVYYVMTKTFSLEVLLLSLACAFCTNTILYAHMLMDFDGDECSHKTTLCRHLGSKQNALRFILVFYLSSFVCCALLSYITMNYFYLLPLITIPQIIDLYKSLELYTIDKTNLPTIKFWHYPLENWDKIKQTQDAPFYFRFFYSRNILIYFMLLMCIAIILS